MSISGGWPRELQLKPTPSRQVYDRTPDLRWPHSQVLFAVPQIPSWDEKRTSAHDEKFDGSVLSIVGIAIIACNVFYVSFIYTEYKVLTGRGLDVLTSGGKYVQFRT